MHGGRRDRRRCRWRDGRGRWGRNDSERVFALSLAHVAIRWVRGHVDDGAELPTITDVDVATALKGSRIWRAKWVFRNIVQDRSRIAIYCQIDHRDVHADIPNIANRDAVANILKACFLTLINRGDQVTTVGPIVSRTGNFDFGQTRKR